MTLRTRVKYTFVYYDQENKKCRKDITPNIEKFNKAYYGDVFERAVEAVKNRQKLISKCLIIGGDPFTKMRTGICIVTYVIKEKFVYPKKIYYVFRKRKDGVKIAFKVDAVTEKMKQVNQKYAVRNDKAQKQRSKASEKRYKATKKTVIKQYGKYGGCTSKDVEYLTGVRRTGGSISELRSKR